MTGSDPANPNNEPVQEGPIAEGAPPLTVGSEGLDEISERMAGGEAMAVVEKAGAESKKISDSVPPAPADGFKNVDEFAAFVSLMNKKAVKDHADYVASPEKFRPRDPENPDKYISEILCECADGRNSISLFLPEDKLNRRFNTDWLPAAGTVICPEMPVPHSVEEAENALIDSTALRDKLFDRLDLLYGPKVKEFLDENTRGISSKLHIEFQSHYNGRHYPEHGCGAHDSNFVNAQKETIKDCIVTDAWLKDRYGKEYDAGLFRVFRTAHDTSENGSVYSGGMADGMLTSGEKADYEKLFDDAARFEPVVFTDKEERITRKYEGNPFAIDTEDHSEQIVRISDLHLAHTLVGQSVMEICWSNDAQKLLAHVNKLLSIISGNVFSKSHPDKPAIVHFDLVKGDKKIRRVYDELLALANNDPVLKPRLANGSLQLLATETDRATMESNKLAA